MIYSIPPDHRKEHKYHLHIADVAIAFIKGTQAMKDKKSYINAAINIIKYRANYINRTKRYMQESINDEMIRRDKLN